MQRMRVDGVLLGHVKPLSTGLSTVCCQVKDTLGALQERFRALKIDGGGLPISRLQVSSSGCD